MRSEKILSAIGEIDGELALAAAEDKPRKKRRYPAKLAAMAACLAVAVIIGVIGYSLRGGEGDTERQIFLARRISAAEYPEYHAKPLQKDYESNADYRNAYLEWEIAVSEQHLLFGGLTDGLESFFGDSIEVFSKGENGENTVFSPVSVYLSLGMMAEITEGDSRAQILEAVGAQSIEELRAKSSEMWNTMYRDDVEISALLNSSLWMNNTLDYREDVLNSLAENYYASSFTGQPGSDEYNELYRQWLNENTGEMLGEFTKNESLDPSTALALVNTVYFKCEWDYIFELQKTREMTFNSPDGEVTAEFMARSLEREEYRYGEKYSAIYLDFVDEGYRMWFILPDEGYAPEEIIGEKEILDLILHDEGSIDENVTEVKLKLPKFDISCGVDLIGGLKDLGITDVFEFAESDFGLIKNNSTELKVSEMNNNTRVRIDEKGCEGASYIESVVYMSNAIPLPGVIDFILDRPFIFAVTNTHKNFDSDAEYPADNLPLFVGIVNDPTAE